MSDALLVFASDMGDPDTWPEAVAYIGLGVCGVVAYYVWARWGQ